MAEEKKTIQEILKFSILNIDKPTGPTSFSVSDFVRRKLGLKKTSHFGTLDPQVTGVLPIALGRACKLTGFFLGHDKTYVGIMHVHKDMEMKELQEIINKKFLGKIKQLPPKKSSVKREIREREIKSFELVEKDERDFLFKTKVQGGTYIRKLVSDLGEEIGGAHMTELRRTNAGIFSENDREFVNLYDFERAVEEWEAGNEEKLRKMLVPAEEAIKKTIEHVECKKESVKKLLTGKPVFANDLKSEPENDIYAIFSERRFIEIARRVKEDDIVARPEFVLN